jgi:hypothetical protein
MKVRLLFVWTLLLILTSQSVDAQKVLLLQKIGKSKRYLFHTGDKILVRMGEPEFMTGGEITYLDDSLCTVNKNYTFELSKIKEVKIKRYWFYHSWKKLYAASLLYAGGSFINRASKGDEPIVDITVPIVSGSFIVLGATSRMLRYRHCRMEDDWKLKVLDFDIYKTKIPVNQSPSRD